MNLLRTLRRHLSADSGAAAVEFGIVLPVLVLIVVAILEFGQAYNAQISLSAAAREGVRVMALRNDATQARTATRTAAPTLVPALTDAQITVTPSPCLAGQPVTVQATYPVDLFTNYFGATLTLTGRGVMRCGG